MKSSIKTLLEEKANEYNTTAFIENDPIQIPHRYKRKEDIEVAGFLTATIAWGQRQTIVKNADKMMGLMGDLPYDFVMNHTPKQLERLEGFKHRTFNSLDLQYFIKSLRNIYTNLGGMEQVFTSSTSATSVLPAITAFKKLFFLPKHPSRTTKHISDPSKGSAAKRLNMMLRWFCRRDDKGVDLGIWKGISPAILSCPLDVHSGKVARALGLLHRKQDDVKALDELDKNLRLLDADDPVKYDFALFGLGVSQEKRTTKES